MLSYEDVEKYLTYIFTGEKYVNIKSGLNDINLIFKYPNNKIKQVADFVYDRSFDEAVKQGMLPKKELEALIIRKGFFTEEDEARILKLESKVKAQEALLSKATKVKANSDRVKGIIGKYRKEITEIKYKKISKLSMSAEAKADEDKITYICSQCTYKEDYNKLWDNYDAMLNDNNNYLREKIIIAYTRFINGLDTSIIRFIARSNAWRIRYISSQKTSDQLFGLPTSEYTTDMLQLVYWSNYYQNIYEMLPEDAPPDDVIEDDDALDAFMNAFYEERRKERDAKRAKKGTKGMSAFDKQEVIVTQSHELYHDIEYDKPKEALKSKYKDSSEVKVKDTAKKVKK